MRKSDFTYELPQHLIAQDPLHQRSDSKLLVMDRATGLLEHKCFTDLLDYLTPGDCLVLNDTKVLPARLLGERILDGEHRGRVEVLLLKEHPHSAASTETTVASSHRMDRSSENKFLKKCYEALVKPGRKCPVGTELSFGDGQLHATVVDIMEGGNRLIEFSYEGIWEEVLDRLGQMPLPPYIIHTLEDPNRYQTVYAKYTGSAAAPTAGLHFTPELLAYAKSMGIQIATVTLHVGLGTFRPVKEEFIKDHHMHTEHYHIDQVAADQINQCRLAGKRIICVGTTSCRTLESAAVYHAAQNRWILRAQSADTDIFLYPGATFHLTDGLITNFHLPQSTLLMLVSAFAGREAVLSAYEEAIRCEYRFFSFGDAMLIL